jgi:hypothetical protein
MPKKNLKKGACSSPISMVFTSGSDLLNWFQREKKKLFSTRLAGHENKQQKMTLTSV